MRTFQAVITLYVEIYSDSSEEALRIADNISADDGDVLTMDTQVESIEEVME